MNRPGDDRLAPRDLERQVRDYLHRRARNRSGEALVDRLERRIRGRSPRELVDRERLVAVRRMSAGAAAVLLVLGGLAASRTELPVEESFSVAPRVEEVDDVLSYVTATDTNYGVLAGDPELLAAMLWGDAR